MTASNTYDPDTVQYPLAQPQVRLSVSAEEYKPTTGLPTPLDVFVERFDLCKVLKSSGQQASTRAHLGIYTHELHVPDGSGPFGFDVSGSDGEKDTDHGNGGHGGDLSLYIGKLMPSTAKRLTFKARGGKGYSPTDQVGVHGHDAGKGGNGGRVVVVFDGLTTSPSTITAAIIKHIFASGQKWPDDFHSDAAKFVKLLESPIVKATKFPDKLSPDLKSTQGILGSEQIVFRQAVLGLHKLLAGNPGDSQGTSGQRLAQEFSIDDFLKLDICYAHPMQCQMLLDKVRLLTFVDSIESKLSAVEILDRLMGRLKPLTLPPRSPLPPLWQAYRNNAKRLFLVDSSSSSGEPVAIQRFRSISKQALWIKQQIVSGKNFFGRGQDEVPRGSFAFYHETAGVVLRDLKSIEALFLQYLQETTDSAVKLSMVQQRADFIAKGISTNQGLIAEARDDLKRTTKKIGYSVEWIAKARQELLDSMKDLEDFAYKGWGIHFQDFVSAMNSVMFTHGNPVMVGLEAANLLDQQAEKILGDDGVAVRRDYLVRKLHDVEGDVKDLVKKYKVLQDGRLNLEDPGGDKIRVAEKTWETLIDTFKDGMDAEKYKTTKDKFDQFYDVVEERNSSILHYNAILALLVQYYENGSQLKLERTSLVSTEYNNLKAGHPAMTDFLKKIYTHCIEAAQVWLYKEQQALRFFTLKPVNVISDELKGVPTSSLNHDLLFHVNSTLESKRRSELEILGLPASELKHVQVDLLGYQGVNFIRYMGKSRDKNGVQEDIVLPNVQIDTDNQSFPSMYDVRLSAVRFYLEFTAKPGETIQQGKVECLITHTGTETFLDLDLKKVRLKHRSISVPFIYQLPKNAGDRPVILSDGDTIGKDDIYARVGPFTRWRVEISGKNNRGIDFTKVSRAYLEFDIRYRRNGPGGGNLLDASSSA